MVVYLLWHVHRFPDGQEDDEKLIGVYSNEAAVEAAKRRAMQLPGFCDLPDGFVVSAYRLDEDHWTDGYVTVTHEELLRDYEQGTGWYRRDDS